MATKMQFSFEGKDYTLEFNRRAVKEMEAEGFRISEITDKPMTMFPMLFAGAFKMHHMFVKDEIVEAIYDRMGDKVKLMKTLNDMYNETVATLMDEPEEGNVEWKIV